MARTAQRKRISGAALRPMLATLIDAPFDDPDWVFETKWDGFRIVAKIDHGEVALYSRNGNRVTARYPGIADALCKVRHQAVLDGELVALDAKGRSNFQALQNVQRTRARLRYYVFDLLFLDGEDVRRLPLLERKRLLRSLLPRTSLIRYSRHAARYGKKAFRAARRSRLEGIMAKEAHSLYHSGRRTRDWLKIKTARRQEVVIVGYTRPRRSREHFGALVLALRRKGKWRYAGRTGAGFDRASLASIHARLRRLKTGRKPFAQDVPDEKSTTWVRPSLVCEVKFTEWTGDGQMRHPAFVGLRNDKAAREVVAETETHVARRRVR